MKSRKLIEVILIQIDPKGFKLGTLSSNFVPINVVPFLPPFSVSPTLPDSPALSRWTLSNSVAL